MRLRGRGLDHRGGSRPTARPHRHPRAAFGARAALHQPRRRRLPARGRGVRRRQPAVVRRVPCGADVLGRGDRAAAAGGRGLPHRLRRGVRGGSGAPRPHEGRPAARRARLLLGQRARVVGSAATGTPGQPAQRAGRRAREAERVRRPRRARVDGPGLPRGGRATARRAVPPHDPHRAHRGPCAQEERHPRADPVHGRGDRRHRGPVRLGGAPRARDPLVGGRGGGRSHRPHGQGPADRHGHDLLARGHGNGHVRGQAACASATRTAPGSRASTTATS